LRTPVQGSNRIVVYIHDYAGNETFARIGWADAKIDRLSLEGYSVIQIAPILSGI
jgi:hypothetical protein